MSLWKWLKLLSTIQIIQLNLILPSNFKLVKTTLSSFENIFLNINFFFSEIAKDIWSKFIVTALELMHYNLHACANVNTMQFVQVVAKPSSRNTGYLQSAYSKLKLLKLLWFRFSNLLKKYVTFFIKNILNIKAFSKIRQNIWPIKPLDKLWNHQEISYVYVSDKLKIQGILTQSNIWRHTF